mgnify:CR=1 FL=1
MSTLPIKVSLPLYFPMYNLKSTSSVIISVGIVLSLFKNVMDTEGGADND